MLTAPTVRNRTKWTLWLVQFGSSRECSSSETRPTIGSRAATIQATVTGTRLRPAGATSGTGSTSLPACCAMARPYRATYGAASGHDRAMKAIARRLAFAPVVVFVVAALTYAMPRVLRPDLYGPDPPPVVSGTAHDVERVFLHFDFGRA